MKWEDINTKANKIVDYFIKREVCNSVDQSESLDAKESFFAENLKNSNILYRNLLQRDEFDYRRAFLKLNRRNRLNFVYKISRSAAAAIFIGLIAYSGYELVWKKVIDTIAVVENIEVKPGVKKARLILADGKELNLGNGESRVMNDNGALINIGSAAVRYENNAKLQESKKLVYNILDVPRGGEFSLTLSDGTKVWLNADSKLKYPVSFSGDKRIVYLEGEAYFEVKKDATHQFIVKTISGEVAVHGTHFNVKGYLEDKAVFTTLVEGSVSFKTDDETTGTILVPGQQLAYYPETGSKNIKRINVNDYISWKDNLFQFDDQNLEDIMKILARWYDVTVFYESDDLKKIKFSGNLDKYSNIDSFFKLFEVGAKIDFIVKNRNVYIKERQ